MSDVMAAIIARMRTLEARLAALERRETPYTGIGARVYTSGAFTHNSTGNWLAVPLANERFDTDAMHDNVTNNSRLTIVTPGTYLFTGYITFVASATGYRQIGVRLDGSTYIAVHSTANLGSGASVFLTVATIYSLNAAQYLELCGWQNSGGSLDIASGAAFSAYRLP